MNKLTLEWRKDINDKSNFLIGASYGADASFNRFMGYTYRVYGDTMFNTHSDFRSNNIALKLGYERKIKTSPFYYGVHGFVGYKKISSNYYESKTFYENKYNQVTNEWDSYRSTVFNDIGDKDGSMDDKFFSTRTFAVFGMNLPVWRRFVFNAFVSFGIQYDFLVDRNIISDTELRYENVRAPTVLAFGNAGLGVRYKLGKIQ